MQAHSTKPVTQKPLGKPSKGPKATCFWVTCHGRAKHPKTKCVWRRAGRALRKGRYSLRPGVTVLIYVTMRGEQQPLGLVSSTWAAYSRGLAPLSLSGICAPCFLVSVPVTGCFPRHPSGRLYLPVHFVSQARVAAQAPCGAPHIRRLWLAGQCPVAPTLRKPHIIHDATAATAATRALALSLAATAAMESHHAKETLPVTEGSMHLHRSISNASCASSSKQEISTLLTGTPNGTGRCFHNSPEATNASAGIPLPLHVAVTSGTSECHPWHCFPWT